MNKLAIITFIAGFGCSFIFINHTDDDFSKITSSSNNKHTINNQSNLHNLKIKKLNEKITQLKAQLAETKKSSINNVMVDAIANVNTPENNNDQTDTNNFSPEEILNRLEEVKAEVELHNVNRNGKELVNLVKELKNYGPAAFPQMVAIANMLDRDRWQSRKFRNTYNQHELDKAFPSEIFSWALDNAHFEEVGGSFRIRAYQALPYSNIENVDELLINSLLKEDNRWGTRRITRTLRQRPDENTATALIDSINNNQEIDSRKKRRMEDIIFAMPGDAVDQYLNDQIANTQDERKRNELKYEKTRRHPPASGFLVSEVNQNSQASKLGLKIGDTIMSYGNVNLDSNSIYDAKEKMSGTENITITVLRDGQTLTFEGKAGRIGINGDRVTKE